MAKMFIPSAMTFHYSSLAYDKGTERAQVRTGGGSKTAACVLALSLVLALAIPLTASGSGTGTCAGTRQLTTPLDNLSNGKNKFPRDGYIPVGIFLPFGLPAKVARKRG